MHTEIFKDLSMVACTYQPLNLCGLQHCYGKFPAWQVTAEPRRESDMSPAGQCTRRFDGRSYTQNAFLSHASMIC